MPNVSVFERRESEVRMYSREAPVLFERASGSLLKSVVGEEYIDFFAGAGALNYGHNDEEMREAAIAYLESEGIAHGLDLFTVAKRDFLVAVEDSLLTPRGWSYRVQFTGPTGADATEAALKLARKATGRRLVVAFNGGFHGMSAGALSVSGLRSQQAPGVVLPSDVMFVPFEDSGYGPFDSLALLKRAVDDPRSGTEVPAAVIVEAVQIQAGVYSASDEWLRELRAWSSANGILLILDEVQAGCGRTGDFFGFERSGIQPDIITLAKSIGGFGFPLAMTLIAPSLDVWDPGEHTGTFRGNQLAFVTGAIGLRRWLNSDFRDGVVENSEMLQSAARDLSTKHQGLTARGRGMIAGIDFGVNGAAEARRVQRASLARGLLVERCGPNGEVIKLMPPVNIAAPLLQQGMAILDSAVTS